MTVQCEYTYLTARCAVQCANPAEHTCDGSFFCGSHIGIARQSMVDDSLAEYERDMAVLDD